MGSFLLAGVKPGKRFALSHVRHDDSPAPGGFQARRRFLKIHATEILNIPSKEAQRNSVAPPTRPSRWT